MIKSPQLNKEVFLMNYYTKKLLTLTEWFRKKFDILKTYQNSIYQAFTILPYSNGITEAINNHIKVIKRIAYGYRRFSYFRLRILIIQHHSQWQKKNVKKVVNG
ncbi:hypothetical protein GMA11_07875 [Granulicatella sp. zg-ZJ]|nr:hypothetical protein [Granulicatella sp. zg-ZJ]